MEYELYLRPREKLRSKGAKALTIVELLQIVLGPGSSQASGAKIARFVEKLFVEDVVSYETLVATKGVGEAKACQILATVELSRRIVLGG